MPCFVQEKQLRATHLPGIKQQISSISELEIVKACDVEN
jgi:hypothetical protein